MIYYGRVSRRTWGDEKFRDLDDNSKLVWLFILTGPHNTSLPGLFHGGPASLAESMGMLLERFKESFDKLLRVGFLKWDPKANVIFIPKAIKHNAPSNPNIIKSWVKSFDVVPESPLKSEWYHTVKSFLEPFEESFRDAFLNGFGNGMANIEQEQEQEQEQERVPTSSADGVPSRKEIEQEFESFWRAYPRPDVSAKRSVKSKTLDAFRRLVKSGVKAADLIRAAENFARSEDATKEGGRYVPGAQVFLGAQRKWEPWAAEEPAPKVEDDFFEPSPEELALLEKK